MLPCRAFSLVGCAYASAAAVSGWNRRLHAAAAITAAPALSRSELVSSLPAPSNPVIPGAVIDVCAKFAEDGWSIKNLSTFRSCQQRTILKHLLTGRSAGMISEPVLRKLVLLTDSDSALSSETVIEHIETYLQEQSASEKQYTRDLLLKRLWKTPLLVVEEMVKRPELKPRILAQEEAWKALPEVPPGAAWSASGGAAMESSSDHPTTPTYPSITYPLTRLQVQLEAALMGDMSFLELDPIQLHTIAQYLAGVSVLQLASARKRDKVPGEVAAGTVAEKVGQQGGAAGSTDAIDMDAPLKMAGHPLKLQLAYVLTDLVDGLRSGYLRDVKTQNRMLTDFCFDGQGGNMSFMDVQKVLVTVLKEVDSTWTFNVYAKVREKLYQDPSINRKVFDQEKVWGSQLTISQIRLVYYLLRVTRDGRSSVAK